MNKVVLSIIASLALCVAAAAQAGPGNSQGTQNSSPTMQNPNNPNQQPGMGPGSSPDASQTSNQNGNMGNESGKSEKKLKGCVMAQGSQATLETKKGKEIALTGQDVSAHNGHEVEVKGNWASGSMSQSSAGASSSGEKTFNVTDVKMLSDTCKNGKSGSSSMGTGANGTNPSGSTGSSPSSNQPQ
jgi:hypothetical protein